MQADPAAFFSTDHYRGYPTVLVRLKTVNPQDLHDVLEQAWRVNAPRKLLSARVVVPSDEARVPKTRTRKGNSRRPKS
jgi:hypothetical protein